MTDIAWSGTCLRIPRTSFGVPVPPERKVIITQYLYLLDPKTV
jgi:hypothetical protein